ncbi:hypothetical protein TcWFU_000758 [Taenia crassiceps]|uniref:Uncharacterized protein n=1 Tax=Taenia crassiceps TaxID=6207 RepID=A0ABR4QNP4_9CEST
MALGPRRRSGCCSCLANHLCHLGLCVGGEVIPKRPVRSVFCCATAATLVFLPKLAATPAPITTPVAVDAVGILEARLLLHPPLPAPAAVTPPLMSGVFRFASVSDLGMDDIWLLCSFLISDG